MPQQPIQQSSFGGKTKTQKKKKKKKKRFHDLTLKTKEQQKTKIHITGPKYVHPN